MKNKPNINHELQKKINESDNVWPDLADLALIYANKYAICHQILRTADSSLLKSFCFSCRLYPMLL